VREPNEQLRQAREQVPSRQTPGECLSRQEVAELVNLWVHERTGKPVAHHAPAFPRSRAISRTKLASLLMATGDPRKAATIGQKALDSAGGLRSRRAIDDLWDLHRLAGRHPAVPEAVELRGHIVETLDAR
jgi:hypothetical protein